MNDLVQISDDLGLARISVRVDTPFALIEGDEAFADRALCEAQFLEKYIGPGR